MLSQLEACYLARGAAFTIHYLITAHSSLPLVRLHQVSIDEDAVSHRPQAGEEELAFLFDGNVVLLVNADCQFVALGETQRQHPKVFDGRLAIDPNLQVADELIEREIDLMLFLDADHEAELHVSNRGRAMPNRIAS